MASIQTRTNKNGEVTGYRVRACVGRTDDNKQVWRTCTIARPENLTPKKELKEVQRLADAWEKAQKEEYLQTHEKTAKDKISFKEFVECHWMPDHALIDHSPSSIAFFTFTSNQAVEFFGNKRLNQIDTESIKRYLNHLKTTPSDKSGKPFSATTIQHCYGTLRNILRYAKRMKYINTDPCADLSQKEKPHREKKSIDFLSSEDAVKFLACLENESSFWNALMNVLICTGLRRGECVGLQWRDLDTENLTMTIIRNVTIDQNAEDRLHVGSTKSKTSRTVPISQRLCKMLLALKAEREYRLSKKDENGNVVSKVSILPTGYIFSTETDPYRPIRPDTVTTWVGRFIKKNNLPDVSPHDLRHTAATLALESGAQLKEVQMLLGHSDPSTTLRFYTGISSETMRRTVDGIESLLAK